MSAAQRMCNCATDRVYLVLTRDTEVLMPTATEAAIWDRLLEDSAQQLTPDAARYFLRLDFRETDHTRMEDLARRAQDGSLTGEERTEYEEYLRAGNLLALIQSRARVALRSTTLNGHG
jgi:hypothetical protein